MKHYEKTQSGGNALLLKRTMDEGLTDTHNQTPLKSGMETKLIKLNWIQFLYSSNTTHVVGLSKTSE